METTLSGAKTGREESECDRMKKTCKFSLNAVNLRYLAMFLMLLDHLWATVVPGNDWMTHLGRLAFPIFAFQTAEGYYHTSNFKQYCRRLAVFALISEIPFNLMVGGTWLYPFHQNVMVTLLLGLWAVHAMECARKAEQWRRRVRWCLVMVGCCLLGALTLADYGICGVMTVLLFAMSRAMPWTKLVQLAGMVWIHGCLMKGQVFLIGPWEIQEQALAVLALVPIWLYHGEKGPRTRAIQMASYWFYPAHMLILGLLMRMV